MVPNHLYNRYTTARLRQGYGGQARPSSTFFKYIIVLCHSPLLPLRSCFSYSKRQSRGQVAILGRPVFCAKCMSELRVTNASISMGAYCLPVYNHQMFHACPPKLERRRMTQI